MAELVQEDKIDLEMLFSAESFDRITRRIAKLVGICAYVYTVVITCIYIYIYHP